MEGWILVYVNAAVSNSGFGLGLLLPCDPSLLLELESILMSSSFSSFGIDTFSDSRVASTIIDCALPYYTIVKNVEMLLLF